MMNIKLNGITAQYFYFIFLYREIILYIRNNYKLHIKNAEEGDSVSQYYIGYYYCYDIFSTKLDYSKAIELYSKSSEGGNIKFELDMKKAFELYLKSAEGGYKLALNELGRCCYFGICTFKDEDKAFEFYLKTAEKCHSYSQYKKAEWYLKLANNGIERAMDSVAKCYRDGIGTNKNLEEATRWFKNIKHQNDNINCKFKTNF
ncbi:HCP-like protein [Rhizophagus irregularis]|uniref:HCP-like protein n=1 Tax=Rhizophagus irregularis TaxID=588596 RepID=A0A2N1N091_9GLOM|nr:HCP-like protein [Rhizophagus irregularis]